MLDGERVVPSHGWLLYTGVLYPASLGSGKAGWLVTCTHPDHKMPFSLPFPDIWLLPSFLVSWGFTLFLPDLLQMDVAAGFPEWALP